MHIILFNGISPTNLTTGYYEHSIWHLPCRYRATTRLMKIIFANGQYFRRGMPEVQPLVHLVNESLQLHGDCNCDLEEMRFLSRFHSCDDRSWWCLFLTNTVANFRIYIIGTKCANKMNNFSGHGHLKRNTGNIKRSICVLLNFLLWLIPAHIVNCVSYSHAVQKLATFYERRNL